MSAEASIPAAQAPAAHEHPDAAISAGRGLQAASTSEPSQGSGQRETQEPPAAKRPEGRAPVVETPAAPAPLPNPLAHLSIPFQPVDYAAKGCHLEAAVAPEQVVSAAEELDHTGFALDTITGVDWLAQGQMEVVYDYFHPIRPLRVVVRARIPREDPEIPTISSVFPGANWHEREAHDFFGIRFLGHPNLTPFLLPEDATCHPLKKDFTA